MFPTLAIRGEGLVLRKRGRTDIPPIITIRAFTIESSVRELWTRHIDRVRLEGLHIADSAAARRGHAAPDAAKPMTARMSATWRFTSSSSEDGLLRSTRNAPTRPRGSSGSARLRFEDITSSRRRRRSKRRSVTPCPRGLIHTVGTFGPWNGDEPSLTPIAGDFSFDADLGTIKGIGGTAARRGIVQRPARADRDRGRHQDRGLSSVDRRHAVSAAREVHGDCRRHVRRHLSRIGRRRSRALAHLAKGAIVRVEGVKGRRITLDTRVTRGRLEDFIKLTTRVKTSPIVGDVDVTAKLDIPPGQADVVDRMDLAGTFQLAAARFTNQAIQERIESAVAQRPGPPERRGASTMWRRT